MLTMPQKNPTAAILDVLDNYIKFTFVSDEITNQKDHFIFAMTQ